MNAISTDDIIYQAYLLILSWPVKEEVTRNGSDTPAIPDVHNRTEPDVL